MAELTLFKVEYYWYEDEHEENLLAKDVEREEFEKDIIKAKKFAESIMKTEIKKGEYLGKGYRVKCLPEYYEQIIWYLTEKLGYLICNFDEDINYIVDDAPNNKILIDKIVRKIERCEL